MEMSIVVLVLLLVTVTYAVPPIVPLEVAACVDGVNNVIDLADISDGQYAIHAQNVVGHTYDDHGRPSCFRGHARVALPGTIRLVRGQVVVSSDIPNIKDAELKLTIRKHGVFLKAVCVDGRPMRRQVPESFCHHKIGGIGGEFLQMLSTNGTYDLAEIEQKAHKSNVINFPRVKGILNTLSMGDWKGELALYIGGTRIAHIRVPSNMEWVHVN